MATKHLGWGCAGVAIGSEDGSLRQQRSDLRALRQEIAKARQELADGVVAGDRLNDPIRLMLSRRVDQLVVEYIRRSRETTRA